MVYCGDCGTQNPEDKKFCWKCGKSLIQKDTVLANVPSQMTNRERLRALGRVVTREEYNTNYYSELEGIGPDLVKFVLKGLSWLIAVQELSRTNNGKEILRQTDSLQKELLAIMASLKRTKLPFELEAIREQALCAIANNAESLKLLRDYLVKHEPRKMAAVDKFSDSSKMHVEKMDGLIQLYLDKTEKKPCTNCRTWLSKQAESCFKCGCIFSVANELGLSYFSDLQIDIFTDNLSKHYLHVSFAPRMNEGGGFDMGSPIPFFIHYIMARISPSTRKQIIHEFESIKNVIEANWKTKHFIWADIPKEPTQDAKCQVEFSIYFITKNSDPLEQDVLVDKSCSDQDLDNWAEFLVPTLIKWYFTYSNDSHEAKMIFEVLFILIWKNYGDGNKVEEKPQFLWNFKKHAEQQSRSSAH